MRKFCLSCGAAIHGRIDKKFCSDYCRTSYHNGHNHPRNRYVRKINYKLRKNRKILARLNPEGKTTVSRNQLLQEGFDFNYMTHAYTTRRGTTYYYCYEQGYLPLSNNRLALIRNHEYQLLEKEWDEKSSLSAVEFQKTGS